MRALLAVLAMAGLGAGGAFAQQPAPLGPNLRPFLEGQAAGALGILGLMAIPDGSASSISIEGGRGGSQALTLGQIGLGFTVDESFPLYLEGFLGYARYDPAFVFSDGTLQRRVPLKWNTVSATVGVGWSFALSDRLQLRPVVNATLGYAVTDVTVAAELLEWMTGLDIAFLKRGHATAAGLGGALVMGWYDYRPEFEFEVELRYSQMRLETLPGLSRGLSVRSDAGTLALWTRYRWPTGVEAYGRPVRWVLEAYHSEFLLDQRDALGFERLTRPGAGIELDVGRWELGAFGLYLQRLRLMGHAVFGDDVRGWSIGLGMSF